MNDRQMVANRRLTIGILVGQEVEWLDRCLEGLASFPGPILVVGSHRNDGAARICEKWGAQYHLRLPRGAFSFARQRGHLFDLCQTPWLLMLDVDERIEPRWLNTAIHISQGPADRAYIVRHRYMGRDGLLFVDHQPRLLPGNGRFPFEGQVANTLRAEHDQQEALYLSNMEIVDMGAVLDPKRLGHRRKRYHRLARMELKRLAALSAQAGRREWAQLGFRYYIMGRPRAAAYFLKHLDAWQPTHQGGQFYLARLEACENSTGQLKALDRLWQLVHGGKRHYRIYHYLSRIHGSRGEWGNALKAAEMGVACHGDCAALHHNLAVACYRSGNGGRAQKELNESLRLSPGFVPAVSLRRQIMQTDASRSHQSRRGDSRGAVFETEMAVI